MQVLILELSSYSDILRDDGSEMRWLLGKPIKKVLGYLDYLRIINRTVADIIGFTNIQDYPIWHQLAVHAHEMKKDVWVFTKAEKLQYPWTRIFHPSLLIQGCCWTRRVFAKCFLNYDYITITGELQRVRRFNAIHRCYKGIGCVMEGN